jgi:CRP-like cAMP-binding protein
MPFTEEMGRTTARGDWKGRRGRTTYAKYVPDPKPMQHVHSPKQNALLAALPEGDYERLLPHLELVALPLGSILYDSGAKSTFVYFPVDCVISRLRWTESGKAEEVAIAGNKGLVGVPSILEAKAAFSWSMVQIAGHAYVLDCRVVHSAFEHDSPLHEMLMCYNGALISEVAQTSLCNQLHSTLEKVCRWLLLRSDRTVSNELTGTRGLIANLLGEDYAAVVEVMNILQGENAIEYGPNRIVVRNRKVLERLVCECYAAIRNEAERCEEAARSLRADENHLDPVASIRRG